MTACAARVFEELSSTRLIAWNTCHHMKNGVGALPEVLCVNSVKEVGGNTQEETGCLITPLSVAEKE